MRLITFGCCVAGLALNFMERDGSLGTINLLFFTVQSNLLVALTFILLLVGTFVEIQDSGKTGEVFSLNKSFQTAVTLYISITFLVFWCFLSWMQYTNKSLFSAKNLLSHAITPILAFFDWLIFMPHTGIKRRNAIYWLSFPFAYYIMTIIRAKLGSPLYSLGGVNIDYPYPFLDPDYLGNPAIVFPVVLGISVMIWWLGLFFIWVDKCLSGHYKELRAKEKERDRIRKEKLKEKNRLRKEKQKIKRQQEKEKHKAYKAKRMQQKAKLKEKENLAKEINQK